MVVHQAHTITGDSVRPAYLLLVLSPLATDIAWKWRFNIGRSLVAGAPVHDLWHSDHCHSRQPNAVAQVQIHQAHCRMLGSDNDTCPARFLPSYVAAEGAQVSRHGRPLDKHAPDASDVPFLAPLAIGFIGGDERTGTSVV